jgi:hypothetical protein
LPESLQPLPDYDAVFVPIGASWASYVYCVYCYVQMVILTPDFLRGIETQNFKGAHFCDCINVLHTMSKLIRGFLIHSPVFNLMPLFLPHCIMYSGVMQCLYVSQDPNCRLAIQDHVRALEIISKTFLSRFDFACQRLNSCSLQPELAKSFLREKCFQAEICLVVLEEASVEI